MSVSVLSGFTGSVDRRSVSAKLVRSRRHLVKGMNAECVDQDTADQVGYDNYLKRHHRERFLTESDVGEGAEEGSDFRDSMDREGGIMCSCDTGDVEFCPLCDHPDLRRGEICICNAPVWMYERAQLRTKRKAVAYSDDGTPLSSEFCAIFISLAEAREVLVRASLPVLMFDR